MPNPPSVFISYRRETSVDLAQRIRDDLEKYKLNVFLDLERLSGGERWKARLQRELVNCDFLLVILAPQTLESEWVRYEIKTALDQNKVIVPITHHGFTFSEGVVPEEITALADFNAIPFVDRYQKASLDEIREALGITATSDSQYALPQDLATKSPSRKGLNPQLVIAIIGLVGVIGAALIGVLPKLLELSSPTPTLSPRQVVVAPSATLLPPTATETPLTPTPEPSLTPLPPTVTPSLTVPPTATPLPPTPTDVPSQTPLPPTAIPTIASSNTLVQPTPIPSSPTPTTLVKSYPCDAKIVSSGDATLLNIVHSEPSQSSAFRDPISVHLSVKVIEKRKNTLSELWYRTSSTAGKPIGWIQSQYIMLSQNCPS